jgi:ParB-like chromosome segregation protein Spo0J
MNKSKGNKIKTNTNTKETPLNTIEEITQELISHLTALDEESLVSAINDVRFKIHKISLFKNEPVDYVRWVKSDEVTANDYNPNSVAPPEMELLRTSIEADGYTQPIVGNQEDGKIVVVDGFHRHRVGKECAEITQRIKGYLPVVQIRAQQVDLEQRMASTIRHNRARGKHKVEAMSEIVIELKRRNWSNEKISKNLGMDADEVLRLCQITGLQEAFADQEFSQSWDAIIMHDDNQQIDEADVQADEQETGRIFHEWQDWECYPAGFYSDKPIAGKTVEDCENMYMDFLSDIPRFQAALERVISEWKYSCEHYLTNEKMNRIAWLAQASMCLETGVSSRFCGGYNMLSKEQKEAADLKAFEYLNIWLERNGRPQVSWEDAQSKSKADLY